MERKFKDYSNSMDILRNMVDRFYTLYGAKTAAISRGIEYEFLQDDISFDTAQKRHSAVEEQINKFVKNCKCIKASGK